MASFTQKLHPYLKCFASRYTTNVVTFLDVVKIRCLLPGIDGGGSIVKLVITTCILLGTVSWSQATTINVAACTGSSDDTKVQTAINSTADGDVVQIPSGNCTFGGSVTWANKNITVRGAGQGITTITTSRAEAFHVTATTKAGFRIADLTINSTASSPIITIEAFQSPSVVPGQFRVDHTTLNMNGGSSPRGVSIQGLIYGLIDHCTIAATLAANIPTGIELNAQSIADNYPTNPAGNTSWNLPLDLGGPTAVYVEDCIITQPYGGYGVVNNITYGGRMVVRYSKISGPQHLQTHSTRGNERGGMRSEYYNNVFDGLNDPGYPGTANIISGTGVVFNNTMKRNSGNWQGTAVVLYFQRCPSGSCVVSETPTSSCAQGTPYDGGLESNGWPCLDQPGRGNGPYRNQASIPVYVWNNGPDDGCSSGGACSASFGVGLNCGGAMATYIKSTPHTNGDKDYCIGGNTMPSSCGNHANGYKPYTYPHPLQVASGTSGSGALSPPPSPTSLTVQ